LQNQGSSSSSAAFVFALPCLFTAFLGTWQIVRRQSKVELVEARTAALQVSARCSIPFNVTLTLSWAKIECDHHSDALECSTVLSTAAFSLHHFSKHITIDVTFYH